MRKSRLLGDILPGLVLTGALFGAYLAGFSLLETFELKTYDLRSQLRQSLLTSNEIVIVAIDDESIEKLGRWPWPRGRIAEMLNILSEAGPRVMGLSILFSEAEKNEGMAAIEKIKAEYEILMSTKVIVEKPPVKKWPPLKIEESNFIPYLEECRQSLDQDVKLFKSVKEAGNVVLPMFFNIRPSLGGKPPELPPPVAKTAMMHRIRRFKSLSSPVESFDATCPLVELSSVAASVGHINTYPDIDGTVRKEILGIKYGDRYYPSFAFQILRRYLRVEQNDIGIAPGESVVVGSKEVPVDEMNGFLVTFNGPGGTFPYYSFYDVLNKKVSPDFLKDKIVLLGLTAAGIATLHVTPVAHNFPGIEVTANVIENLLHMKFMARPEWAFMAELACMLAVGLFITFLLPRLRALWGALASMVLLAAVVGGATYLFVENSFWLKVTYPTALLALGYTVVISRRFFTTERKKELVEASRIETNKMLGLSFQGQGLLDIAFEKFKACPVDEGMEDLLYNLGLDFERKRQYNKAVAVYETITGTNPKYKDIQSKMEVLRKAAEGVVFAGGVGKPKEATMVVEGLSQAPTLGRYELIKELGRGAMGIVYLGKDPKINRPVAIKTMRFEDQEEDAAALKQIKERFFREAESAGNLSHPNIIRIFDAGEEQDISYIAMELLDGHDLKRYCFKESLLPIPTVLDYCAKVAEALDYAHTQGVVHRDIKPANVMLLSDGTLRVTDFGIARITATSKTSTGTVLGTPLYMSPEQVSGKKVDGRSDIFSLGTTLFELLTGEKPWKGSESLGALLFQIANDPHPDPLSIRPDLPAPVTKIIAKALEKDHEKRYQKAGEMAQDLRNCAQPGAALSVAVPPTGKVGESGAPAPTPHPVGGGMKTPTGMAVEEGARNEAGSPLPGGRGEPGGLPHWDGRREGYPEQGPLERRRRDGPAEGGEEKPAAEPAPEVEIKLGPAEEGDESHSPVESGEIELGPRAGIGPSVGPVPAVPQRDEDTLEIKPAATTAPIKGETIESGPRAAPSETSTSEDSKPPAEPVQPQPETKPEPEVITEPETKPEPKVKKGPPEAVPPTGKDEAGSPAEGRAVPPTSKDEAGSPAEGRAVPPTGKDEAGSPAEGRAVPPTGKDEAGSVAMGDARFDKDVEKMKKKMIKDFEKTLPIISPDELEDLGGGKK